MILSRVNGVFLFMVRFCDNEVCCILNDELNREMVLNYFYDGHMDDIVCVIDKYGKYIGKIVYYSLINKDNIIDALQEDYVVMDRDIWNNARNYFVNYKKSMDEYVLLPVVNENKQLISFAYEDSDANREIRMLRELMESQDVLQFLDLFPEYNCVKIYDFNELAYFFAIYLKSQNINVQVVGDFWKYMHLSSDQPLKNCRIMEIFAEGITTKKTNWIENLFESASVEFECIDVIYEENIKIGTILDTRRDNSDLISIIRNKKEIIILGTEVRAMDVYDYLSKNDINVCCFVSDKISEQGHKLFGKDIISSFDARKKYKDPVFIEGYCQHSAWGFGGADYFDYIGYKRNDNFFLIRDYVNIEENTLLIDALKSKKIFFTGNIDLCMYLKEFFIDNGIVDEGYLELLHQNNEYKIMPLLSYKDIGSEAICLIAVPEFFEFGQISQQEEKKQIKEKLKEYGLINYLDYFSYTEVLLEIESKIQKKYFCKALMPKKIIIGSIEGNSGNDLFRGLLDGHPSILMINCVMVNRSQLNNNLFWTCIQLSRINSEEILSRFWKIYAEEGEDKRIFQNKNKFNEKMEQLLMIHDKFTSQELFVMIHIAIMYMNGRDILESDIKNMIIYWEPHQIERSLEEDFVKWLGDSEVSCDIINVVRNIVMYQGCIKFIFQSCRDKRKACDTVISYPTIEKKEYQWGQRQIVKFEDIKCNPKDTLTNICDKFGIQWDDSLMLTTCNGEKHFYSNGDRIVCDFDLSPVFNMNEKIFSEFDRFRIMLINSPWQRKYGYPCMRVSQFQRRQLQKMFLKKFRFEEMIDFYSKKMERDFKIGWYTRIRMNLQKVRMIELLAQKE